MKRFPLSLTDEQHTQLKILAAQTGRSINAIIIEALQPVFTTSN